MWPQSTLSRREMLQKTGTGLGMLGLAALMNDAGLLAADVSANAGPSALGTNPLVPKPPHFPGKVRHVIHIYLNGGPAQMDTFDPKPMLQKYAGQLLPQGNLTTERPTGAALPSPF